MAKQIGQKSKIHLIHLNTACETGGFLMNKVVMFLRINGFDISFDHSDRRDIVLINTCCFTTGMTERSEARIAKSLKETTAKKVIIFGCFHIFAKKMKLNDRAVIVGPKELEKFNDLFAHRIPIEHVPAGILNYRLYEPGSGIRIEKDYFVMICQGCLQCCSYCNIKKAKGKLISRSVDEIIDDIQKGLTMGRKDFVLIGDDCGSYGGDLKTDLAVLIKEIIRQCPEVRLKIHSIFPGQLIRLFSDLRKSIASGKIILMTLPIQSGSERILKLMNRGYDLNRLKEIIKEIRFLAPSLFIKAHIIVNFPTETMEDLLCSFKVLPLFNNFEIINYSNNPMTPASQLPQVEPMDRETRLKKCEEVKLMTGRGYIFRD